MPKYKPLYSLYKGLRENKYDVPDSYASFQKTLTQAGDAGAKSRRGLYQSLKDSNYDVPDTYEDFYKNLFVPVNSTTSRALKIGENPNTPTVNRYRQKMFDSVDPNKNGLNALSNRAVGQAVRATNNVRKPVTAKVVNQHGKPTGEEFAITPAKTVEDLDREYAQEVSKNWENELHDQMADADRDAAKISDMFKSFIGSTDEVGSVWGNMTRGGGIAGTPHSVTTNNGILENTEARQLLAAGDYNRKRRELLQLEQDSRLSKDTSLLGGVREAYNDIKNGEFSKAGKDLVYGAGFDDHSFWRGMYDAAKDTGFLTGGASDLINAGSLLATKQDLDNGVHTEAGDMLLQQAVKNSDAQSQYGDNQGWMYAGGVITTNMAPFVMQIASAGFSKGMSNAIGKVVQSAASKVALGTMKNAARFASADLAKNIGKFTGLTTKAFGKAIQYGIVGAAQANTVGLGNVANDVINRYTGQVYQDEQGNYKFGTFDSDGKLVHEGGEDFLTALVKGEAAQTIEFATELAGGGIDAVGTSLKNFVTKGGKKIIEKYNMENVSKVINFLLNNKVSKNARYLKAGADRTLGKVELNSIVGESLEEELGIIANTVFTGDNKISDLWDEKQQSRIWGGMFLSIGLMKGAVAPFHAYNAKQYYSYKHKLDKADVNLSQLLGKDKWEELRNQIDATTNEDMPEMVNKINRDVALGKNRQPVREYIQNLLIMRGYDIGNMLAAKKAVEDKGEGVSVKNMEKNQAYQQGRDAYGYDTHEIQLDQEDKQKSLAQLLGISEQQLASMSDEELDALSGRDDNIYRAIYDYQLSSARYEGVIDNARDQIDLEVQRAAQAVDMYTDKSRNTIRNATIKATGGLEDYGVYIINGNIATHEDGSIDISNSDDMILYYDPTTNTVEHADAMMFAELGSEENADEVRSQAMADAKEKAIKETTGIIDGVVEVGTQFKTVDADGTEHTYEVLADNGDGTAVITIDGNIPTELVKGENVNIPVSFEELQKMKDESDQQRLQAAKAEREQMEKERAEQQNQQTEQTEETQPSFDFNQILDDNGNVVLADVLGKDGNTKYPNSQLFLIRDSGAKAKVMELTSDGSLVPHAVSKKNVSVITSMSLDEYKQAMVESSMIEDNSGENRGEIEVEAPTIEGETAAPAEETAAPESTETPATEQTPAAPAITLEDGTIVPMLEDGNPDFSKLTAAQTAELYDSQFGDDAESVISSWVSDAKKALDKANNMTVKGKTFVEQKAAKDAKEKAIADAQAAYDSAIAIRDAYNERQLAKVEDTAEGRKELIEKARRKFARLKNAVKNDAEAVAQLYNETVGSLLHRLYDGTGIDVTDTIPLTAEEYVASNLGAHSLNYEGTETSKGVKQETGLSREDFAKTQLLAADGKGTTIDNLVHSLWENRPSNLESLGTQDIRNALLSVITSGFKASEARNYIENLRIAQAENMLEEQKKAADNAAFADEQKAESESQTETAPESEENTGEDNSDEITDEENEQTNENINAPEVPEDATDENPLGLQLSEDKVPFEIEGGKSGETYDINDNEDRQRLINDNKVDDKDILDIDMPKHVHKAIKELCKKMGLKVQFLYMGARSNGWIENGTMYLALDTEKATQFVFGHEMTHAIKQKNPEAYKELIKVAMAVTTKKKFEEDLAKVYQNYHGISGYNNVDDYVEEVVADNLGKFINDFDLAQKFSLRLNHPVLATILHAIQKIKSLLYGDFYKSVDALERIVEKAYVDTAKGEVTNSETGEDVSFSLRQKPEPKKKGIGYKVFVLKDGKLYPPMVANPDGAETPVGVWLDADAAPIAGESKTGRPQVKQGGKGTQGGSGKLAYRQGWHLGVVPYAIQFNRKDADGNKTLFPKNFVFAEVEYAADVDYQEEARQEGINPSGKYQHSLAGLKHLPTDGFYMYRTNPNPETAPWVITGAMKVNRILTRTEQAELVKNAGREPQQIQDGDIVTDDVVNSINQEIAAAPKFSLKVYHGSGADFTEFDFDHMGEGAGSQVFGWGGYVTSSKKIGKDYAAVGQQSAESRHAYSEDTPIEAAVGSILGQEMYNYMQAKTFEQKKAQAIKNAENSIASYSEMLKNSNELDEKGKKFLQKSIEKDKKELEVLRTLTEEQYKEEYIKQGRAKNLYEVDIPDDNGSNYLEWENPLNEEQINTIREALVKKGVDVTSWEKRGFKLDLPFKDVYAAVLPMMMRCEPKEVSKFLSSLGFTGIKYPAGTIMGGAEEGDTNYVIFKPEDMRITEHTKFSLKDPFKMSDNEKKERGDRLIKAPAVDVASGAIKKTPELSARRAAEKWWNENVEQPLVFNTEVGDVEINDKSIKDSLAHRYRQAKLDAITSLPDGFGNAVYLGTMKDFTRDGDVNNHYFAYPINYDGQRNYVFCRAMQDANKNRLYVHEVFVADKINEGNTLQTTASQPHGGIALYKEILANVLSAAKIDNSSETAKENDEKVEVEEPKTFEEFLNHPSLKFSIKNEEQRKAAEDAYEYASKLRPNKYAQYALVDMSNPSNSPEYYEKKVLADRWRRFYNKAVHNELDDVYKDAWGNYKLFDLDRPFADQVNEVKGDVPSEFNAPDVVANKNADNESGVEYHEYKQGGLSSVSYKDRYKAFKQHEANREKVAGLKKERKETEDSYNSKSKERAEYNKQLMKEYMDKHKMTEEYEIPDDDWEDLRSKSFEKYQDELDSLFNKYKDLDRQIKAVAEPRFSLKDEKTLAGVHNITEEKLRKALKLGGFANPSLAVIDTNKTGHDNFGEISFIAPSALLDKRTGKTAGTWITDAYTQRYPSVEREMSEKGSQKFRDWVDSLEYPSEAKAEIKRQAEDALSNNNAPAWELMYLKEKGIDIKEYNSRIDYRWKEIIKDHPTVEDILNSMNTDPELNEKVTGLAKHIIVDPIRGKISLEVRRKIYEETGVKMSSLNPQVRKQTKEIFERDYKPTLLDEDGNPKEEDIKKVVEDIVNEHNDTKKYDFYLSKVKASNYVNKNGLYDDFIKWQESKLDEFGTKNRIFRGYNNDGTRKYVPETLENVSKAMREDANGQTNGSEYTSFGSFIAKLASRVDSTDEMRANKDKLSSNKDKEEFYEKWSDVYYELAKFLYNDVFYGEQRLHDIVSHADPKKYAKKEYGITLTPTFMKKLDALKNAVQTELKSAYFETKYNRPLHLNEFAAAVVPDNLGEDVRKGIENAGLPMYDYDPNKEGDRSRAFNEAINSSDNIRFSLKAEKEKIVADAKANGTYMTAPNGEKTKLDAEQWATVRTANFKNWFGDWENHPENASKVVDENGEPMVVWHGRSAEFNTFEKKEGVRFIMGLEDKVKAEGFFFSPDKGLAEEFASNSSRHRGGKANVVPCFLNIRKPMDLTGEDYDRIYEDVTGWEYMVGMDTQDNLWGIMDEEGMADKIKEKGYDGAIFVEEVDDSYEPTKISYCALDANQIKSAENNNGDFSADNNDIRYSIRTYHGTGASFDKFDLSHALEGEGSETFGHGVYVTNSSKIGREYAQRAKNRKMEDLYKNMRYPDGVKGDIFKRRVFGEMVNDVATGGSVESAKEFAKKRVGADANDIQRTLENLKDREKGTEYEQNLKDRLAEYKEGLKWIDSLDEDYLTQGNANRYDVDIPDDNGENYLGWNESQNFPLEKWYRLWEITHEGFNENEYFKDGGARYDIDRIERITQMKLESPENGMQRLPTLKGEELYHALEDFFNRERPSYGAELASRALSEIGFVGIKYPAGLIHGGAEEGDYNYVIFDENNANIVGNTRFSLRYDQFEHDLNQWKKDNNLPKDAQRPTIPQRNAGESAVDFLKRVDEYRKQMALWKTAPTYEQHLLSDDTALGEFNRELQRGSVLKRIAFQDSMLAIRKAQEAIMKEVGVDRLNMAEDAYTAENRSHGKGKNEFEEYNNEFLQPLRKAYHQMKKILGDSYDNVRIYMMAKHGLERDAQMAFKKSLDADFEDVAQRSAAYRAYKGDMNRITNDSDLEFGRVDFNTWRQRDNALRTKYSPSYMDYRYDENGIAYDYSGLSALFGGSDFEEAAHKLVRDIESSHVAEVQDLWNATNAATKKILRDGYKAGMMSKDTYQYVRDMYSHYIPLRGWDGTTADQVWDYIGGGKGAFNQTLKTAHGRTSIANDPIAYIENMAESGILLNNKNWVKQHLMLLAQNHPTSLLTLSKAWYVKSTDANGNEEWIPATPQITSQMNSNQVKAAIDAFEQKMENMAQTGDATQKRDGLNIAYPQTHSEEREHEVRVMKDGEEYVIYVNGDPQLAQAMNNTRAHRVREIQSGKLDRAAAWLGRKMAAAYTSLSPLFIPSNYFRDLTMTLASTAIREDAKYNYLLRKNLATSWNLGFMLRDYQNGKLREKVSNGNATPKEQMFYDFMMNGGETGFVSSLDVEDLKKKFKNDLKDLDRWKANPVKVGHTIMDGIEFLNRAIEDSNRFAVYMTSIQYGRSIDEAVNDAKDVTLNFNRKGTGEYGWQMIRNLYLFINPAVQSLQTLGALAKHHPFKFTAVTASWLASGVLVPIVNAALMNLLGGDDDKDKYWQFTKWDRRNNLIMWVPFTHEYVKIPLAQEFRAFYGVGDMIASKVMGGELAEESWSQYAEDLLGQVVDMLPLDPTGYDGNIAVSLMPNAIRPVFELAFNVDFTGKPLFKDTEYNKYDPNFTKAYVGTPDWLVRASRMVNSIGNDYPDVQQNSIDAFGDPRYNLNNPAVVDHVLSSYLGGAYTMGSQVLGLLTKSLNDPKEIKVADIPLFSKFVSNPDDRPITKKQGDEFWDMKENHDRAANTLSKLKKQAKVDGDYSLLERFYGSEEYKQYKQDDVKVKKYEEDKKKERAEESGEEYRPHKLNAEDIYKAHATPKDDFEDLKLKQLYTKLNGFKTAYDLLVDTAPSQSDGYYNTNKAAIDAIDEISLDKQEISELKKGFLDDGKDAYNAEDMKLIRDLRKKILAVLEKANKVVVANQKAKTEK
mgnify:CR=1 FL=1